MYYLFYCLVFFHGRILQKKNNKIFQTFILQKPKFQFDNLDLLPSPIVL